jgi:hypothetical protein
LQNHNKKPLDVVKILEYEHKHSKNQEKRRILDEETTKILEDEICKKIEETLKTIGKIRNIT